jgi:hypothetical protein
MNPRWWRLFPSPWISALAFLLTLLSAESPAGIVLNEFMAAPSQRRPYLNPDGIPRLGPGLRWMDPRYAPAGWSNALLPAGYGFSGLSADLSSKMRDKAPSLYLRKAFLASDSQAGSSDALVLSVQFNDGFVAYLNGREIARANCGPSNSLMYACQPAYNVNTNGNVVEFYLGSASAWLVPGTNLLALQAHNADQPSTDSWPERISSHLQTTEFRMNAGLRLTNAVSVTNLIAVGPTAGIWQYWVGLAEPSGGVVDLGLVTKPFVPPAGTEDDYDAPAQFSDWLELLNNGAAAVDLSGWSLTDDPALPGKWRFPTNTVLASGACLVLLCDSRDEANAPAGPATRLHTNFKLSGKGEYLAVFDSAGRYVDGLPNGYPDQSQSCSYGRNPTNSAIWGFLELASPGSTNSGPWRAAQAEPPRFTDPAGADLHGGIYRTQSLTLCLTSPEPGSLVRYTLNGSEPTESNGWLYTNMLTLTQPLEKTGVVIRARAFVAGLSPSEVKTHTYLLKQPWGLTNLPALLLTGEAARTWYAPEGLLAIVGGKFLDSYWLEGGPQSYNNALGTGEPFERQAHFEYYFPAGYYPPDQAPVRTEAGVRLSASSWQRCRMRLTSAATASPWPWSDQREKPSFNIYFSGDYGPSSLHFPFFTNYPVKEFDHLRLRAGKNDNGNPFVTDELVRRLYIDMGQVGARGSFCSLYLNGVYKGVYNLAERVRENFFQNHYQSQAQWDVCYTYDWVSGDATAYNQLLAALDQNLTNLTAWQSVTRRVDIDNAADYFLLNIFAAMWDWPGNNFIYARERSTGPNSPFRFVVWDAEGGFNAIGYGHPVNYNTITNDLIVPPAHPNYNVNLPRIFRRLATSPEFRLRFADRVNLHLFNGGVLDERDPDGAGPRRSNFRTRVEELSREAGDLVRYNTGQSMSVSAFYAWAPARRIYLLGSGAGRQMLRNAGLWPVTEPPVFSQFGGVVPPGYPLSMTSSVAATGQTATIYFTLDGTDPRLTGGSLNPSAQPVAGPLLLNGMTTVKARARNDQNGEWSPLTAASFVPGAVPASSNNLAVAELLYHPPGLSAAELSAGFTDVDDFEFVRLLNIGDSPIDLAGAQFSMGITFDFAAGAVRYLSPGAGVLVVKNLAAFRARYGTNCNAMIAGAYSGNLSNGGERLQLLDTNHLIIQDFYYGDSNPWPAAADGDGPSLILRDPALGLPPFDPSSWVPSAVPGGLPSGTAFTQTYQAWRALYWAPSDATNNAVSGMQADPDLDGLSNFAEYAFGLDPHRPSARPRLECALEGSPDQPSVACSMRLAAGAVDAKPVWEISENLREWSGALPASLELEKQPLGDGTALFRLVDTDPQTAPGQRFFRLRIVSN